MLATFFRVATRYACHTSDKLSVWSPLWGPDIPVTLIIKGTRQAYYINHVGDQVCLSQFLVGTRNAYHALKFPNSRYLHLRINLIGGNKAP